MCGFTAKWSGLALAGLLAIGTAAAAELNAETIELHSINSGAISAIGHFQNPEIRGGSDNSIGVSAQGAMVSVTANWIGDDSGGATIGEARSVSGLSIGVDHIEAQAINSGDVSATGSFNNGKISASGRRNSMSVQAVGAGISITARSSR